MGSFKIFEKERVCVIDYYPTLMQAVKDTNRFCLKHGIQNNRTKDIFKILTHNFLVRAIVDLEKTPSNYPKVFGLYKKINPIVSIKVLSNLLKTCKQLNIPSCDITSMDSPDVPFAAEKAVAKYNHKNDQAKKSVSKMGLKALEKKIKSHQVFNTGSVSAPETEEQPA